MKHILLVGAGKIGRMITAMLSDCGDYHVTVADYSKTALDDIKTSKSVATLQLDVTKGDDLAKALDGKFAVLSACPFDMTKYVAKGAVKANVHYFDLTEDVETTRLVKQLASSANCALVPQCGLAPGFISIVAYDLTKKFDSLREVHMRVGALPKYPSNALKYNLTWSTDGLINEYCNPCEAIVEGKLIEIKPLGDLEEFSMDGTRYEAFNTSGGLGTLCDTLDGKVDDLNYKTVRYLGHRDIIKMLLHDLRLIDRRDLMKDIFEYALPITYQDVVLVFVSVTGKRGERLVEETYAHKVYSYEINGENWSAIQITTAAGICTMLDLVAIGKLPQKGFIRQEDTDFQDFITNRFGRHYA